MTDTPLRADGRTPSQLRPVSITRGWSGTGEGSALIEFHKSRSIIIDGIIKTRITVLT